MNAELTRWERRLRWALIFMAGVFVASIALYVGRGVSDKADYAFVANSATKDGLFLAITLLAVANIRRFAWLTLLVILGHLMLVVAFLTMIAFGDTSVLTNIEPLVGSAKEFVWVWMGVDIFIAFALFLLYRAAMKNRYGLKYLSPFEYSTVKALSEVLVPPNDPDDPPPMSPSQVAKNADDYLYAFAATGKWKVRVALGFLTLYPLPFHLPFPAMEPNARLRFVRRHFMKDGRGRLGRWWQALLRTMIGAASQLVYLCYYGDERTFESVHYTPYSQRPGHVEGLGEEGGLRHRPGLTVREPSNIDSETIDADVVIVGSGAAGAILTYELAARGRKVLVLERGRHTPPADFTENERDMLSKLYADGALQLSRDLQFAVLQGMCVGGSTVVNNAVCIPLPKPVLERWNNPSLDAGIEPDLWDSFVHIKKWLLINQQSPKVVSGGAQKFAAGAAQLDLAANEIEANIVDCLGCGYCNIGCKYGRKLSMLDTVLPWAQEEFPGMVEVRSQCHAESIEVSGNRAEAVRCRLPRGRSLRVRANTVIVSAGAINSSLLLQRSSLGGPLVGKYLSFNMATPLTAHFEGERLDSCEGLQISHYAEPPEAAGAVLETWFNPPAMQSLFMPGWFGDHSKNMEKYDQMACAGAVVGTQRNGEVGRTWRGDFGFEPQQEDLEKLMAALKEAGRIFFAADATSVMPSTFRYHEFRNRGEMEELNRYVTNRTGISLNSAHPQGGNVISTDSAKGVVDENFRVHDFENLHVCDASVFPTSITVNPQYTVMALAHYAATRIAGPPRPRAPERAINNSLARIAGVPPAELEFAPPTEPPAGEPVPA